MAGFTRIFEVGPSEDRHATAEEAVQIDQRVNEGLTWTWTMSEADLAALDSAIRAYRHSRK